MKFFAAAALVATAQAAACDVAKATSKAETNGDLSYVITWADVAAGTCDITAATYGMFSLVGNLSGCTGGKYAVARTNATGKTCGVSEVTPATAIPTGTTAIYNKTEKDAANCATVTMTITTVADCKTFAIQSEKDKVSASGAASFAAKSVVGASAFALASVYFLAPL